MRRQNTTDKLSCSGDTDKSLIRPLGCRSSSVKCFLTFLLNFFFYRQLSNLLSLRSKIIWILYGVPPISEITSPLVGIFPKQTNSVHRRNYKWRYDAKIWTLPQNKNGSKNVHYSEHINTKFMFFGTWKGFLGVFLMSLYF